jgi:Holliday junction resolvasome RuvABC endonuclease subunit
VGEERRSEGYPACKAEPRSILNLEVIMSVKRIVPRKKVQGRAVGRQKKRIVSKDGESGLSRRLEDLREQVDIILPEMTARIAALEHLLLEKHLCTRRDLIDARQFVRMQEA